LLKIIFKVLFLFLFQKGYYKQLGKLLQNFTETKTTANGDSVKVENGKDHNNDDSVENGSNGSSNNGHQETNGSNGSIEQCDNDCHDNTKETNGSLPSIDDKIKKNENQEEVTEITDDNNENKRETIEITEDNENKRETTTIKNDDQKVGWYRIFPMRLGLWCLMPHSTIFQFYWSGKPEYPEKTTTCRKSLTILVIVI
jgi:hypothetical protein